VTGAPSKAGDERCGNLDSFVAVTVFLAAGRALPAPYCVEPRGLPQPVEDRRQHRSRLDQHDVWDVDDFVRERDDEVLAIWRPARERDLARQRDGL
jgi:hypothetical protein